MPGVSKGGARQIPDDHPTPTGNVEFDQAVSKVLQWLSSKSLLNTAFSLRKEVEALFNPVSGTSVTARNQFTSDLERDLNLVVPIASSSADQVTRLEPVPPATHLLGSFDFWDNEQTGKFTEDELNLFNFFRTAKETTEALRMQRGNEPICDVAIFHPQKPMLPEQEGSLVQSFLPLLHNPHLVGLQDMRDLTLRVGSVVAGRYQVAKNLGSGSFSTFYGCFNADQRAWCGLKVLRNDKDCMDTGLGETHILALVRRKDPSGVHCLLQLHEFFYYKEHLFIVTELLHRSLFICYRAFKNPEERLAFFAQRRMAVLADQMLDALAFLHQLGVAHCDVKPENICLAHSSQDIFKLIDFGSAVLTFDIHNSYVQSRWYRAPEVILGCRWGFKVDVWSLGCVLAELIIGQPLFRRPAVEAVLAAQVAMIGSMPPHMLEQSPDLVAMFFTSNGHVYQIDPPGSPAGAYLLQPMAGITLAKMIKDAGNPTVFGSAESLAGYIDLIEELLKIDPDHRVTAAEALDHPWLRKYSTWSSSDAPSSSSSSSSSRSGSGAVGTTTSLSSPPTARSSAVASGSSKPRMGSMQPQSSPPSSPANVRGPQSSAESS